jgi:hypothetical protein
MRQSTQISSAIWMRLEPKSPPPSQSGSGGSTAATPWDRPMDVAAVSDCNPLCPRS